MERYVSRQVLKKHSKTSFTLLLVRDFFPAPDCECKGGRSTIGSLACFKNRNVSYVAYSLLRISLSGLGLEEDIIRKMPMPYRNARRHIQEITEWWAYIRTETFWDSAKRGKQLSSDLQPITKRVRGLRLIFKVTSLLLQFVSSSSNAPIL